MEDLEETPFLKGKLTVFQPKKSFRFGIDSVLLANFVTLKPKEKIAEFCAGSGVISFITLLRFPKVKVYLLELEELYLEALKKGIEKNSFKERAFPVRGDVLNPPFKPGYFDVIFSNPPYFKKESGRISPFERNNLARRETKFDLKIFLKKVSSLLKIGGRFYLIFTAFRLAELIYALKEAHLEPKVLRLIYSYPGDEARLVLIKAIKGAREEIRILPPLFIYLGKSKEYSEEVKKYLNFTSESSF
ncbi:MAG: tRNA1(Val) (adenine(37)-N6)-methyltransferase [Caldimicrobium sp.]|jgi:tRNA1(Val) A37 N6-methylase TrmN6